jgi:hypothetical protein
MVRLMFNRRQSLRVASLLAVAAALPGLPARAFRIQEEGVEGPRVRAMREACETRDAHARLAEELIARLEGTGDRARASETVRAMSCPLCGCRLADGLPDGAQPPKF